MKKNKTIWTIGHSTRSFDELLDLLLSFKIQTVADIRSLPGSRNFPRFNKEILSESLKGHGIAYIHIPELGGWRKPKPDTRNRTWKNEHFRGYADHMDSEEFESGLNQLKYLSVKTRTVMMCSEALWWKCHRALVSDKLKQEGWKVLHIMNAGNAAEHPYTSARLSTHNIIQ